MASDRATAPQPVGHATFRLLDPYSETLSDEALETFRRQLTTALRAFPELNGETVTVSRIPPTIELRGDPTARAQPTHRLIELPFGEPPSNLILFHELAHLAIYLRHWDGEDLPRTSEEFTSLYALARMSPDLIYGSDIPYFGEVEAAADDWPAIARAALAYREEHGANSHYVQRAREWFDGAEFGSDD